VHLSEEICDDALGDCDDTENVLVSSGEEVLNMQTAKAEILNPRNANSKQIRLILDTGSQRT